MTEERISGGYAALKTDSTDVPVQVSGIALGEGDITRGGSGKKTLWPRETLEEAAKGLEGQPLATDQNHTTDGTQPQTPSKAVIGEITWSGYKPGVGVLYEAELDDPDIARSVENGRLEVSPLVSREVEPLEDHPEAEFKATEITRWRDLATVVNGAAPSNEITVGDNPMKAEALHAAVETLQEVDLVPPEQAAENARRGLECVEEVDTDAGEAQGRDTARQIIDAVENDEPLSEDMVSDIASFDRHREQGNHTVDEEFEGTPCEDNGFVSWQLWGGSAGVDWAQEKNNQMESMALEALKEVAGVEFEGTATGDLDESEIPNEGYEPHYMYPGDTKSESSYPVVDAEGNLRRGNVDAAWQLGARGGRDEESHDRRLMELANEFDTPPEWAETESMAAVEDVEEGTLVKWNSSGDRDAYGMVEEVRTEGDEPLDSEIDGDQTINPPAALITVHTPGEEGWTETETQVGHTLNTDTLSVIDELPDAESLAKHYENMEAIPAEFKFDNPGEAVSKAKEMGFDGSGEDMIHTHGDGDDTVFMPAPSHDRLMEVLDTQNDDGTQESMSQSSVARAVDSTTMNDDEINAVVSAAESMENPVDRVESLAAADDPKIVEQDTYEALNNAVESLDDMMSTKLIEDTGLSENAVEAMSFEAKSAHFETDEGDFDAEALVQSPETGQPDESETEALSEDADMDKAEALYADMNKFDVDHKDTITEALGVSDWDTAQEVLD